MEGGRDQAHTQLFEHRAELGRRLAARQFFRDSGEATHL
jgi:hypothetical protein